MEAHFGGPGQAKAGLRDMLAAHIEAVPAGGHIDWVTYYFRDRRLALGLLRAHKRGVEVNVTLSGNTRTPEANAEVLNLLSGPTGLGSGLRVVSLPGLPAAVGRGVLPRIHEKLYCFSHPRPTAYIGSFNPSSDDPELRPDIIAEIGDHERGWNALVAISEPQLVAGLVSHARRLHDDPPGLFYRFEKRASSELVSNGTSIYFWPRLHSHPVLDRLQQLSNTARVRIAASHVSAGRAIAAMVRLAHRGVTVEIIAEATKRRVTGRAEKRLRDAGITFSRFNPADGIPMHLKFLLAEDQKQTWVAFGSFNWTIPSMYLNHEIAAISNTAPLCAAFATRWELLKQALHPATPAAALSP